MTLRGPRMIVASSRELIERLEIPHRKSRERSSEAGKKHGDRARLTGALREFAYIALTLENAKEKIDSEAQLAQLTAEMDTLMKRANVIVLQYEQRLAESNEKKDKSEKQPAPK